MFSKMMILLIYLPILINAALAQERDKDAEILRLKEELRQTQKKLEQATRAGFIPVEEGFSSAQEIINALPKQLELNGAKPWDAFQWEEVKKYLKAEIIGKPFAAKLHVNSVKIKPNREAANDPSIPKFDVDVLLTAERFPMRGVLVEQELFRHLPLRMSGNDELAEKARKIQKGKAYEIKGIISAIEPTRGNEALSVKLELARWQFEPLESK